MEAASVTASPQAMLFNSSDIIGHLPKRGLPCRRSEREARAQCLPMRERERERNQFGGGEVLNCSYNSIRPFSSDLLLFLKINIRFLFRVSRFVFRTSPFPLVAEHTNFFSCFKIQEIHFANPRADRLKGLREKNAKRAPLFWVARIFPGNFSRFPYRLKTGDHSPFWVQPWGSSPKDSKAFAIAP